MWSVVKKLQKTALNAHRMYVMLSID